MSGRSDREPAVPALSDSELRVLPLLATTLSLGQIADALELPRDEVVAHTKSLYTKLEIPEDPRRLAGL
jgi:DNA-binding NarL/FixJ family response regulator